MHRGGAPGDGTLAPALSTARCTVHVFKEGALSALGHDVDLEARDFTLTVEGETSVRAECRTESLRVLGHAGDAAEIESNLRREVLETARYPTARFESTRVVREGEGRWRVSGTLTLHGVSQPVEVVAVRDGSGTVTARFAVDQPRFGIRVFKAALGALRVKREVMVEVVYSP